MSIIIPVLITLHIIVCLLLVLVVLMQRPRSEGLGAAFGGSVTENIFGAQTTHVLAKFTTWLGIGFFVLTLLLAMAYTRKDAGKSAIQRELMAAPVPVATPTPVPVATPDAAAPTPAPAPADATQQPAAPAPAPQSGDASTPATPETPATQPEAATPPTAPAPATTQ